jgi:hypothetical protein
MKPVEIAAIAGALLFLALCAFIGVTQGQENKDCRKSGGVPVKVERGYQCIRPNAQGPAGQEQSADKPAEGM